MIVWWNEAGEILACHQNRGGFEVAPPVFAGSMEIPDTLGDVVGAAPRFHRIAAGVLQATEDEGESWVDVEIPVLPVPASITRWQGRRWLLGAGLFSQVEAMIAAAGDAARIDYGVETWQRDNPLFEALASALFDQDTPEQVAARVDEMFRQAAQISV